MTESKYIIVCCDGTGVDGIVAAPDGSSSPAQASSVITYPTNISRLARSFKRRSINNRRQVIFYQSVSEAAFNDGSALGSASLSTLGTTVSCKIRDAYVFIAQNYENGDEIFLFGFSHGAYTVRKLSGLIDRIGLLSMKSIGRFFDFWMQVANNKTFTLPSDTRYSSIKAVGVFDTVGSSQLDKIYALGFRDTTLPAEVSIALHALAFHESRAAYLPILWRVPDTGLKPHQVLKQVWFSGDHSDIGGGWERHELGDISLAWMVGELQVLVPNLAIDIDLLESFGQVNPDPWGTSQPHRIDLPITLWPDAIKDRRSAGLSTTSDLHSSLLTSPTTFTPQTVITMVTLFGAPSNYPPEMPLNDFERLVKNRWGQTTQSPPPGNYDPSAILPQTEDHELRWVTVQISSDPIPNNAIVGGQDASGGNLYIGRVQIEAPEGMTLYPGEYTQNVFHTAYQGFDKSFSEGPVEVLVGKPNAVIWTTTQRPFDVGNLNGLKPVEVGMSILKEVLYSVRASVDGKIGTSVRPGWVTATGPAHKGYRTRLVLPSSPQIFLSNAKTSYSNFNVRRQAK
ncbi:hypothetical protein DL96DRAFT_1688152 [Flagelloscypha sp. PMI_526]|nr:hypothetical protein DL96DRAFT_1688152 [Flagelloscypha sp. PMI_526]